jgi:hypothetical protein
MTMMFFKQVITILTRRVLIDFQEYLYGEATEQNREPRAKRADEYIAKRLSLISIEEILKEVMINDTRQ